MSSSEKWALNSALMLWIWAVGLLLAAVVLVLRRSPLTWNPGILGLIVVGIVSGGGALLVWMYRARLGPVSLTSVVSWVLAAVIVGAIGTVWDGSSWWRDGLMALAFLWPLTAIQGIRKGKVSDDAA